LSSLIMLVSLCARSQSAATLESTEVHADRTITFRLRMPFAHKVEASIDPGIA
jgi:hypothetical protein